MAEIIPFKKREPKEPAVYAYTCTCGCLQFEIFSDGSVDCCACGETKDTVSAVFEGIDLPTGGDDCG